MRICFWQGTFVSDLVWLPPTGTPYLVDQYGREVEIPSAYLSYISQHKGRTRSPKTWRTYGFHLYGFFGFLEANKLSWDQKQTVGKPSVVALYREWNLSRCEVGSVNDYLGTICRFYYWAHGRGLIREVPWDLETVTIRRSPGFLEHANASGNERQSPDVKLREFLQPLEVLQIDEAVSLLDILTNRTHNLMTRLALATGLRSGELLTFPAAYVTNPSASKVMNIRVDLDPDDMEIKYGKPRSIYVSRRLMRALWDYAMIDRTPRARVVASRGGNPSALFLTRDGDVFHEKSYNKILRDAGKKLGRHVYPHLLRHTFATHVLLALSEKHNSGFALKWVKDRLGHESVKTTMRYLHLLGELHVKELDAYQERLDGLMDAA